VRYYEEARQIWQNHVPARGQADTVQGELLRAVEKLRNEAHRNGNLNWDGNFERLVSFLRQILMDRQLFDSATRDELDTDLDILSNADHPVTDDELFDRVTDRIVEWCRSHPEPISHAHDPDLHI
jgi:hypothetical protein